MEGTEDLVRLIRSPTKTLFKLAKVLLFDCWRKGLLELGYFLHNGFEVTHAVVVAILELTLSSPQLVLEQFEEHSELA